MPKIAVKRALHDHLRVLETDYLEDALRSAQSQVGEIRKQIRERRQSVQELQKRELAALTTDLLTKAAMQQIAAWGWLAYPEQGGLEGYTFDIEWSMNFGGPGPGYPGGGRPGNTFVVNDGVAGIARSMHARRILKFDGSEWGSAEGRGLRWS